MKTKSFGHPLVGRGVHQWEGGAPNVQGTILAVVPTNSEIGDCALVELFEWITGSPTLQLLVPLGAMVARSDGYPDGAWSFYDDPQHRNGYWEAIGKYKAKVRDEARVEKEGR